MYNEPPRRRGKRKRKRNIWSIITSENFPQKNDRHQITDPGSSENTKHEKHTYTQKSTPIKYSNDTTFKKKARGGGVILQEARGKNCLTYRKTRIKITLDFSSKTMEARILKVLKDNYQPNQNFEPCEIILQKWRKYIHFLPRKTEGICL